MMKKMIYLILAAGVFLFPCKAFSEVITPAQEDLFIESSASPEESPSENFSESFDAQTEEDVNLDAYDTAEEEYDPAEDNLISVSFQDADINQVIKVLGDISGTVIIPHDDLKGKITVISMEKVELEVVANVLKSALMTKGFTLIRSGHALKVVTLPETKQTNVAVEIGSSPDLIKEEDTVITQVMSLKYSSALQMKTILQPLVGKHGNILASERTNTLIVTDFSSNIKRLATIINEMERPLPAEKQVKTFFLNYGDAEKVAGVLNNLSKEDKDAPLPSLSDITGEDKNLQIYGEIEAYAEVETSSIVVASAPVNFPAIEQLIQKLDMFPPQAMIEVVIMDVTLDDDFSMGIEFSDSTTPALTTKGFQTALAGDAADKESIFHSLLGLATDASTAGFTYRILNAKATKQALAFILDSQENSKVLSTPKILASNNQESSITVGQEIPLIESSSTDLTNNVRNVDFRYVDVGLTLKVTPRISHDGYVNLKIHAELKDLSAQTILDASVINKREADAVVLIPDGHTVVLGGLMRDNNSVVEKKIPLLGDIPFLGSFFKKTVTSLLKTELLIFLTPYVIENTKDLDDMTTAAQARMQPVKEAQTSQELKSAVQNVVGFKKSKKKMKKKRQTAKKYAEEIELK